MSESESFEQEARHGISEPVDTPEQSGEASFDRAMSAVESRWTSHAGEAPEHEPVAVAGGDGGWEPVVVPDGEEVDEGGGVSDGSEPGQDAGSMS